MAFLVESFLFLSTVDIVHKRAQVKSMTNNQTEKASRPLLDLSFALWVLRTSFLYYDCEGRVFRRRNERNPCFSITAIVKDSAGEMARKGSGSWLTQMFCHFFWSPYYCYIFLRAIFQKLCKAQICKSWGQIIRT